MMNETISYTSIPENEIDLVTQLYLSFWLLKVPFFDPRLSDTKQSAEHIKFIEDHPNFYTLDSNNNKKVNLTSDNSFIIKKIDALKQRLNITNNTLLTIENLRQIKEEIKEFQDTVDTHLQLPKNLLLRQDQKPIEFVGHKINPLCRKAISEIKVHGNVSLNARSLETDKIDLKTRTKNQLARLESNVTFKIAINSAIDQTIETLTKSRQLQIQEKINDFNSFDDGLKEAIISGYSLTEEQKNNDEKYLNFLKNQKNQNSSSLLKTDNFFSTILDRLNDCSKEYLGFNARFITSPFELGFVADAKIDNNSTPAFFSQIEEYVKTINDSMSSCGKFHIPFPKNISSNMTNLQNIISIFNKLPILFPTEIPLNFIQSLLKYATSLAERISEDFNKLETELTGLANSADKQSSTGACGMLNALETLEIKKNIELLNQEINTQRNKINPDALYDVRQGKKNVRILKEQKASQKDKEKKEAMQLKTEETKFKISALLEKGNRILSSNEKKHLIQLSGNDFFSSEEITEINKIENKIENKLKKSLKKSKINQEKYPIYKTPERRLGDKSDENTANPSKQRVITEETEQLRTKIETLLQKSDSLFQQIGQSFLKPEGKQQFEKLLKQDSFSRQDKEMINDADQACNHWLEKNKPTDIINNDFIDYNINFDFNPELNNTFEESPADKEEKKLLQLWDDMVDLVEKIQTRTQEGEGIDPLLDEPIKHLDDKEKDNLDNVAPPKQEDKQEPEKSELDKLYDDLEIQVIDTREKFLALENFISYMYELDLGIFQNYHFSHDGLNFFRLQKTEEMKKEDVKVLQNDGTEEDQDLKALLMTIGTLEIQKELPQLEKNLADRLKVVELEIKHLYAELENQKIDTEGKLFVLCNKGTLLKNQERCAPVLTSQTVIEIKDGDDPDMLLEAFLKRKDFKEDEDLKNLLTSIQDLEIQQEALLKDKLSLEEIKKQFGPKISEEIDLKGPESDLNIDHAPLANIVLKESERNMNNEETSSLAPPVDPVKNVQQQPPVAEEKKEEIKVEKNTDNTFKRKSRNTQPVKDWSNLTDEDFTFKKRTLKQIGTHATNTSKPRSITKEELIAQQREELKQNPNSFKNKKEATTIYYDPSKYTLTKTAKIVAIENIEDSSSALVNPVPRSSNNVPILDFNNFNIITQDLTNNHLLTPEETKQFRNDFYTRNGDSILFHSNVLKWDANKCLRLNAFHKKPQLTISEQDEMLDIEKGYNNHIAEKNTRELSNLLPNDLINNNNTNSAINNANTQPPQPQPIPQIPQNHSAMFSSTIINQLSPEKILLQATQNLFNFVTKSVPKQDVLAKMDSNTKTSFAQFQTLKLNKYKAIIQNPSESIAEKARQVTLLLDMLNTVNKTAGNPGFKTWTANLLKNNEYINLKSEFETALTNFDKAKTSNFVF